MDVEIKSVIKTAKGNLLQFKSLVPVMIFFVKGKMTVLAFPFKDDREKDAVVNFIRTVIDRAKVDYYFFIMEAWIAEAKKDSEYIRPRDNPKRKECIVVSKFSMRKKDIVVTIPFKRLRNTIIFEKERSLIDNVYSRFNIFKEELSFDEVMRKSYGIKY